MESFGHMRGNRLRTRPYANTDIKRREDKPFAFELDPVTQSPTQVQSPQDRIGAPELLALQNEFTIQNERLELCLSEWKESNREILEGNETDIDDTVTTVMDHIREILNEAELLKDRNQHFMIGDNKVGLGNRKSKLTSVSSDQRWTSEDRTKLEGLATDLRSSIDLLFELSSVRKRLNDGTYPTPGNRGRAGTSTPARSEKSMIMYHSHNTSEETLVNNVTRSTTFKTTSSLVIPEKLDPTMLELPAEQPPPYDTVGATQSSRLIGFLRSSSDSSASASSTPVLVEYAPFDPAYRVTDVPVPQERLSSLLNYRARAAALAEFASYCSLPCLGFFEDPKESRFAVVYKLPDSTPVEDPSIAKREDYVPMSLLNLLQQSSRNLNNTNERRLIAAGPPLESRFRLAYNVLQAFSRMYIEEGLMHKDFNSGNIIFFRTPGDSSSSSSSATPTSEQKSFDVRLPYISSFDLFSEHSLEKLPTDPKRNIYRHPEDPRVLKDSCNTCRTPQCKCNKARFDLYGLALVLLEIGLWCPIAEVFKDRYTIADFRQRIERVLVTRLPSKCGSTYANVVKDMLAASDKDYTEEELRHQYNRWCAKLKRCLMIDEQEDGRISPETSPVGVSLAGLSALAHDSPSAARTSSRFAFSSLHQIPTAISSFMNNPFSKISPRRTPLPFAISEEDSAQVASTIIDDSLTDIAVEQTVAATIIQKAWRSQKQRPSLAAYRQKVTIIQRLWRKKQALQTSQILNNQAAHTERNTILQKRTIDENTLIRISHEQLPPRPKLRIFAIKLQPEVLNTWHQSLLPRIERILERVLKDSDETVSIDLLSLGETALAARPTIFITCSSIAKVKHVITRKLSFDTTVFDLKVRRGKIRRSKVTRSRRTTLPHRSMANEAFSDAGAAPLNPFHQQRPLCGASIGAFVGNRHLPPVSFGGMVNVDGETYGMTVHHLLDAPSDDEDSDDYDEATVGASRSSARAPGDSEWLQGLGSNPELGTADSMFPLEISDDDEFDSQSDGDEAADFSGDDGYCSSDDEGDDRHSFKTVNTEGTMGDLNGYHPEFAQDIVITQPALDDVDDDFFPCIEDRDDDHLDSHHLGHIHASSGIRRWNRNGVNHEIDWALLKLEPERMQPFNLIQGGRRYFRDAGKSFTPSLLDPICRGNTYRAEDDEYPNEIARADELGNLTVHCIGRTSGLQGGVIGCAMSSVRIYRRRSFSRSWHVVGDFGVGGDSGAWVLDNSSGAVCGHVLAWCDRNAIAYICPMQVLLEDIKRTLGARRISLPGGSEISELSTPDRPGLVIEGLPNTNGSIPTRAALPSISTKRVAEKVDELVADIGTLDFAEKHCGAVAVVAEGDDQAQPQQQPFRSGKFVGATATARTRPLEMCVGQLAS